MDIVMISRFPNAAATVYMYIIIIMHYPYPGCVFEIRKTPRLPLLAFIRFGKQTPATCTYRRAICV